ncbi:hypothetical protein AB0P21_30705 [Kribbella sp. NPDC056861]|uniref:hypothetical protein n=1 Tax=Kribbella sp. NPDC056861 TaxID=3154857 RepID=UPI0034466FFD
MPETPSRQRNAISQGMALGLLVCGHSSLPFRKVDIDLAFAGAWRSWAHRDQFPQVNTDLKNGSDPVWVITHADAKKQVRVLHWEQNRAQFDICIHEDDWTVSDPEDLDHAVGTIDGQVPLSGWTELARNFLERFEQ